MTDTMTRTARHSREGRNDEMATLQGCCFRKSIMVIIWQVVNITLAVAITFLLGVTIPAMAQSPRSSHQGKSKPPQATVSDITLGTPPAGAVNLFPLGDFETPDATGQNPKGWQAIDGLVWQWVSEHDSKTAAGDHPSTRAHNHFLRINTDINQSQAYAWWIDHYIHGKLLSEAPKPAPTRPPKYDTIAGLDGGFYWSEFFPIEPGKAYKVYIDARGPRSQVFLRGYVRELPLSFADESPAVQQVFRQARHEPEVDAHGRPIRYRLRYLYTTWFAVGGSKEWRTYTHIKPRHPTSREITRDVRYLRVMIYPFWPPGVYDYDNVRVVEVPSDPSQARPPADKADLDDGKVIR
jgi:hypothetical protein